MFNRKKLEVAYEEEKKENRKLFKENELLRRKNEELKHRNEELERVESLRFESLIPSSEGACNLGDLTLNYAEADTEATRQFFESINNQSRTQQKEPEITFTNDGFTKEQIKQMAKDTHLYRITLKSGAERLVTRDEKQGRSVIGLWIWAKKQRQPVIIKFNECAIDADEIAIVDNPEDPADFYDGVRFHAK